MGDKEVEWISRKYGELKAKRAGENEKRDVQRRANKRNRKKEKGQSRENMGRGSGIQMTEGKWDLVGISKVRKNWDIFGRKTTVLNSITTIHTR